MPINVFELAARVIKDFLALLRMKETLIDVANNDMEANTFTTRFILACNPSYEGDNSTALMKLHKNHALLREWE